MFQNTGIHKGVFARQNNQEIRKFSTVSQDHCSTLLKAGVKGFGCLSPMHRMLSNFS